MIDHCSLDMSKVNSCAPALLAIRPRGPASLAVVHQHRARQVSLLQQRHHLGGEAVHWEAHHVEIAALDALHKGAREALDAIRACLAKGLACGRGSRECSASALIDVCTELCSARCVFLPGKSCSCYSRHGTIRVLHSCDLLVPSCSAWYVCQRLLCACCSMHQPRGTWHRPPSCTSDLHEVHPTCATGTTGTTGATGATGSSGCRLT